MILPYRFLPLNLLMMTSLNESIFRVTGLLCREFTGEFPSQRPVTLSLMLSLICAWTNYWANNGDAGDLRRHRTQYSFTVMFRSRNSMVLTCILWMSTPADVIDDILSSRNWAVGIPFACEQHSDTAVICNGIVPTLKLIILMTFSNSFSWMKMAELRLKNFTESHSQVSNKQHSINGSDNGLAPTRRQAIVLTNGG